MSALTRHDIELLLGSLDMARQRVEKYDNYPSETFRRQQIDDLARVRAKLLDMKRTTKETP